MASRFQESKRADAREAQIAAQAEALKTWLEREHPDIRYGEAVLRAFQEDMGSAFFTATDDDFEYSLSTTNTNFSRRRVSTETEVKADLIDQIMEALQGTNNPHWSVPHNVKTERTRISYWAIEQLRSRLNEVIEAQRLQKMSTAEIRQELQTSRPAPEKKVLPADITPAHIHSLRSNEIRALIQRYGSSAVNDRLFARN